MEGHSRRIYIVVDLQPEQVHDEMESAGLVVLH
jgi:hypothetical protein